MTEAPQFGERRARLAPGDVAELSDATEDFLHVGGFRNMLTTLVGIEQAPNLLKVEARNNMIESTAGLESLTRLQDLCLYGNKLRTMEASLRPLTNLTRLDLAFNKIKEVENTDDMPDLRELLMGSNRLRSLAPLAGNTRLRVLDAGANRLRDPWADLAPLAGSLQELWLGKNKIASLAGIGQLTSLVSLDLQSNRVESIAALAPLTALQQLIIGHNPIQTLDTEALAAMAALRILDVTNCNLVSLACMESCSPTLEDLWMGSNGVAEVPEMGHLRHLRKLGTLYLEHNPVAAIPDLEAQVQAMLPWLPAINSAATAAAAGGGTAEGEEEEGQGPSVGTAGSAE